MTGCPTQNDGGMMPAICIACGKDCEGVGLAICGDCEEHAEQMEEERRRRQ